MSDRAYALRVVGVALVLLFGPFLLLTMTAPAGTTYTGLAYYPRRLVLLPQQPAARPHLGEWLYRDYFTYLTLPPAVDHSPPGLRLATSC